MPSTVFQKRWNDAKTEFEAMTQKKKPREKLFKKVSFSYTGLHKKVEACDKAYDAAKIGQTHAGLGKITLDEAQKLLDKFRQARKDFQGVSGNYCAVLKKEIQAEKDLEKDEKSVWERGLKYLDKELKALDSVMDQYVGQIEVELDQQLKALSTQDKQIVLWEKNMQSALGKGLAAAGKLKMAVAAASKNPELLAKVIQAYNTAIPGRAGRDVCMQLVVAEKIGGLTSPAPAKKLMIKWNTATGEELADTATADDVMAKVKQFNQDVKFMDKWFGTAVATKLS